MFYPSPIRTIHFELTNRCNAACPQCSRTGTFAGNLSEPMANSGFHDITIEDVKKIFESSESTHIERVVLCGNFGDPMVCPDIVPIMKFFAEKNLKVRIATNGSIQSEKWWKEFADIYSHNPDYLDVHFHIDGDEDTNHLYRVNTNYEKILKNATAYIQAGGRARWVFIPFDHNEHVIEKCRELSSKMGFWSFDIKRSYRTSDPVFGKKTKLQKKQEEKTGLIATSSDKPKNKEYVSDFFNEPVHRDIRCFAKRDLEIFVSCDGDVFPCCWWGEKYYRTKWGGAKDHFSKFFDGFEINLRKRSFTEIVDDYDRKHNFIELMWEHRMCGICNKQCGTNLKDNKYIRDKVMWDYGQIK